MGNDYKKQTSTISAARAMEVLLAHDFKVAMLHEVPEIKKAYRADVMAARRRFGEKAAISNTGRSVTMVGFHIVSKHPVRVDVPLFEMLGHGAKDAIEKATGITFTQG